jgi:hypothetical protein
MRHQLIRGLLAMSVGAVLLLSTASVSKSSTAGASTVSGTVTYTGTAQSSVPLPSSFTGSAGGDGWAVALSSTQEFNVFHHQPVLTVACHFLSDTSSCWSGPKTVTDGSGHNFATSAGSGLYLDQSTHQLFVFAVRTSDHTAGVVCIDTTKPASATGAQLFCGFTALSAVGDAPIGLTAGVSAPVQVGSDWYSFNEVAGVGTGTENKLLCFDLATHAACANQPFALAYGGEAISSFTYAYPIGAAGTEVIVQVVGATKKLACFQTTTDTACGGSWPVTVSDSAGSPFPSLNSSGAVVGTCVPIAGNPCFTLTGAAAPTPAHMASTIGLTYLDNGPALTMGTRVYVPNYNTDQVDCYDYAASASCPHFPKSFTGLNQLYTVNADPQRPTCIWVNSDHGHQQIQNFDATTGGACPITIKARAANIVAPYQVCIPSDYSSLTISAPARNSYTSGTVQFEDANGTPLSGIAPQNLSSSGSVDLAPFHLTTRSALPQFDITLLGASTSTRTVSVRLTWEGTYAKQCTSGGQTVSGTGGNSGNKPFKVKGYWLVASDGGIFAFGDARFFGSTGNLTLNRPVVGMGATPDGRGYWLVASDGGIFSYGDARFFGSTGNLTLNKPIEGMASTPDGKGYWLVASDGGIFSYGDARFFGSTGNIALNRPVVGMAATPDGKGYWLVASDGGIFSYGDARFFGSTGNLTLNKPIVGMAATPDGKGYWLVASDGGIFSYGDARFFGSTGNITLNKPIEGMAASSKGNGYWLVASDGGIFSYGNASFYGSTGAITLNRPIQGMAT